jgi:hypothetical protein
MQRSEALATCSQLGQAQRLHPRAMAPQLCLRLQRLYRCRLSQCVQQSARAGIRFGSHWKMRPPFQKVKTASRATAAMKAAHWSLRWVALLGRQDEPPTRWKSTAIPLHSETGTMTCLGNISGPFTLPRQKIRRKLRISCST